MPYRIPKIAEVEERTHQLVLEIPENEHQEITEMADAAGLSVSDLANDMLAHGFKWRVNKPPKPKTRLLTVMVTDSFHQQMREHQEMTTYRALRPWATAVILRCLRDIKKGT